MKCKFEFNLYIINDDIHTDYEIGNILSSTLKDDNEKEYLERLFEEEFDEYSDDFKKLLSDLYGLYDGQHELTISVDLSVNSTRDYFGEYDEEIKYDYTVIKYIPTDYFDQC